MLLVNLTLALIMSILIVFNKYDCGTNLLWQLPLWFILSFVIIALVYVLLLTILAIFVRPKDPHSKTSKMFRTITIWITRYLNDFFGINLIIENQELIPQKGSFLIVSNHQSNFDPIILYDVVNNNNLSMIMKDQMLNVPILRRWLLSAGFLPLNRDNNRKALKTVLDGVKWVESGNPIAVYPEGTRSKSLELLPFKNGAFKIALKAECPIVVCTCDGMYKVRKNFPFVPTNIYFKVSEVMQYEDFKDLTTNEIGNQVRDIMLRDLQEAKEQYPWLKRKHNKKAKKED